MSEFAKEGGQLIREKEGIDQVSILWGTITKGRRSRGREGRGHHKDLTSALVKSKVGVSKNYGGETLASTHSGRLPLKEGELSKKSL